MIADDFKIDFENKKIIYHPEKAGTKKVYPVRELYSYLQDCFDEPQNMKYETPIEAKSKTEFMLVNGWTMDEKAQKHLKGGTLTLSVKALNPKP